MTDWPKFWCEYYLELVAEALAARNCGDLKLARHVAKEARARLQDYMAVRDYYNLTPAEKIKWRKVFLGTPRNA